MVQIYKDRFKNNGVIYQTRLFCDQIGKKSVQQVMRGIRNTHTGNLIYNIHSMVAIPI